jgi:hypothetical protein
MSSSTPLLIWNQLAGGLPAAGSPGGHRGREVPQPVVVALVGSVEAAGANLGTGRAEEQLRGGRLRCVVEVPADQHVAARAVARERRGRPEPGRDRLRGTFTETVADIAPETWGGVTVSAW